MLWPVLALVVVGFVVSLPLTALLVRAGHRFGALDSAGAAGHAKRHLRPVPNIGGIAVYVAVVVPLSGGILLLHLVEAATWEAWLPGLAPHLPRLLEGADGGPASTTIALALIGALTAVHLVGLWDDRRSVPPLPKLVVQTAAALVLAIWFDVRLLTLLGPGPSVLVTVIWIVAVTNAINFIDNMDGLAGGVGAIAATLFLAAAIVNQQWFIAALLALLVGALAGFLVFNFPPARIFLGDGGSLLIGFLLAVLTARTTFYDPAGGAALGTTWYGVFMPIVVLAVPLYDLVVVTAIRVRQGRSPLVGDQQHFSHRLVERGLSPRGAVVVIWALTAVTGIGGVSMGRLQPWQAALVGVQTLAVLGVIALLEHAARHTGRREDAP